MTQKLTDVLDEMDDQAKNEADYFVGFKFAKASIRETRKAIICFDEQVRNTIIAKAIPNIIKPLKDFNFNCAKTLLEYATEVVILNIDDMFEEVLSCMRSCLSAGLKVKIINQVKAVAKKNFEDIITDCKDGIVWYGDNLFIDELTPDEKVENIYLLARLLAVIDHETKRESYADMLGNTYKIKGSLKKEIKLIISEQQKNSLELGEFDEFSSVFEKNGCYWSRGTKGSAYPVSNFTMRILYHVDTDRDDAYRLVELKNVEGKVATINLNTDNWVATDAFRKIISRKGNFVWKGSSFDHALLQEFLQKDERPTQLVQVLGYNRRADFFAFGNGIVDCTHPDLEFKPVDEYGILNHAGKQYFIPAHSKVYSDKDHLFANDKKFIYIAPKNDIKFKTWVPKLMDVYGNKSMAGLTWLLSALFRDIVFVANKKRFPILNLYGMRGSGKGTFAESLLHIFGIPQDQIMLGGQSTIVAFMRELAQFFNSVVWLDEYKNNLDKKIIESVKNIFDGIGYKRGKRDNSFETEIVPVNSGAILSGQEMPTIEPALFTRVIMLSFSKGEITNSQRKAFSSLSDFEMDGLSHISVEVIRHRNVFAKNYADHLNKALDDFTVDLNNAQMEERMIRNNACLIATYRCLAGLLDFPFSEIDLRKFLRDNLIRQNMILAGSDDVSKWWDIVQHLFNIRKISRGEHFELEDGFLFLKVQDVHGYYLEEMGKRRDPNVLQKSTLEDYLEMDSAVFSGRTKHRFTTSYQSGTETLTNTTNPLHCMKFIYGKLSIDLMGNSDSQTLNNMGMNPDGEFDQDRFDRVQESQKFKNTSQQSIVTTGDDLPF